MVLFFTFPHHSEAVETHFGADEFSYEDLRHLILANHLQSIEAVLPRLPTNLRANYTLLYDSRSLQEASKLSPRVIMFGTTAKLTCTFNGDPSQEGYDSLECFQFRDHERKFDFRQIQFPTPKNGLSTVQFSQSGQTVDHSSACTSCHRSDPRPNWDHYSFWPGAYGGQEDKISFEQDDFLKFNNVRSHHPRYKWLIQDASPFAPYRSVDGDVEITRRPNFRMSDLFGRLNALRGARLLFERLPEWENWAFVVSALHCVLTPQQIMTLKHAGFDSSVNLQMDKIFNDLTLPSYVWSTQIAADPQNYPDKPWEHQSGFAMFSESVAMALIQEQSHLGNIEFSQALREIALYYKKTYYNNELQFNQTLNNIVPSPDYFGTGYQENLFAICPEATRVFVSKALRSAFEPRQIRINLRHPAQFSF